MIDAIGEFIAVVVWLAITAAFALFSMWVVFSIIKTVWGWA